MAPRRCLQRKVSNHGAALIGQRPEFWNKTTQVRKVAFPCFSLSRSLALSTPQPIPTLPCSLLFVLLRYGDDDESEADEEEETGYSAAILKASLWRTAAENLTGIQLLFEMDACFGNNGEWKGNYVCDSRCCSVPIWINGCL